MKFKNYFLYFLLFVFPFGNAIGQFNQWEKTIGGTNFDEGISAVPTIDGGYAITGTTQSYGQGGYDVYVVKVNSAGKVQWTKTIGGTGTDIGYSIIQTSDKGYAVAGYTNSFGAGGYDVYVIKLDSFGNLNWTKTIGGSNNDYGYSIVQSKDNGYIIAGSTGMLYYNNAYLIKLDSAGTLQWTKASGFEDDVFYSIIKTKDGGYAVAGHTESYAYYSPKYAAYVVKLDSACNIKWTRSVGGSVREEGAYSIIQSADGGYITAGYTMSFGQGGYDVYVVKLDSAGKVLLTKTVGGSGTDVGYSIVQAKDKGFFIAGITNSYGGGGTDVYLIKLDSLCNLQWTKTMGGSGDDEGYSMINATNGGYLITGRTSTYGAGNLDVFLIMVDSAGNGCSSSGSGGLVSSGGQSWYGGSFTPIGVEGNGGITSSGGVDSIVCKAYSCYLNVGILSIKNVICYGTNSGRVIVNVSGGAAPYTYDWMPNGGTTDTANNIIAGNYTLAVIDNNGCQGSTTVTITQMPQLKDSINSTCATCCNCKGTTHIYVWQGTKPYTYLWSNGGTYDTLMALSSATYSCTVTDSNGCSITDTIFVHKGAPAATSSGSVSCYGGNDGTATIALLGNYSYSWSPGGQTGATATGLSAGTYCVQISSNDTSNCFASYCVTVTQPAQLTVSAIPSNVLCNGGTGSATSSAGGGTPGYNYSWAPSGGNGATANGLSAGTYTVTVTDANSCTASTSIAITQPPPLTATYNLMPNYDPYNICSDSSCYSLNLWVNGGTPPYTYSYMPWTICSTVSTFGNITDANGCGAFINIDVKVGLSYRVKINNNVTCYGGSNGSATVNLWTGGGYGCTYNWSPGGGTNQTESNLSAGVYTITVTDNATGCQVKENITITQPTVLLVNANTTSNELCNGEHMGSASSSISGGTTPYTYLWSGGHGTSATTSGLSAGTYTVKITDNNGCTGSASVVITQPPLLKDTIQKAVICVGDSATLNDISSGGTVPYTYLWNTGGTNASISIAPVISTKYLLTVTDANGCVSKDSSVVKVNPLPNATLIAQSPDTICNTAGVITLFGGPSGGTYSGKGVKGNFFYPDSAVFGVFNVFYYSYTDSNGCSAIAADSLMVEVCTGIKQLSVGSGQLSVYPNPNNGIFTIQSSVGSGQLSVEIYDVFGQKVTPIQQPMNVRSTFMSHSGGGVSFSYFINLSSQPNGVYFYRVLKEDGGLIGEGKIVVEK